ncbi:pyridoxal-phosphate dependent enzyme [Rhodococcus opacus]|nr:pyridoxal-phosphate dependent enzyme [Rhodococcus opacus]
MLVPQGKIAMGKLAQAVMHGARIIQVQGNFDDCLELARKTTAEFPTIGLVKFGQPGPHRGPEDRGVRDLRALGKAPDVHALPVGNAGNITAYWRGYSEYYADGLTSVKPRMLGVQAGRGAARSSSAHR